MVYIPGFLINKVYDRGSLENTGQGFSFRFTNNMTPVRISGMRDISLQVDGRTYPVEDIELMLGGSPVPLGQDGVAEQHTFGKGSSLRINVRGDRLAPGRHTMKINFITNEYGGATLKVSDSLGGVPLLECLRDCIDGRLRGDIRGLRIAPGRLAIEFPLRDCLRDCVLAAIENLTSKAPESETGPVPVQGELGGQPLDPDFSRLEAALRREEPDRVPLFEAEIAIPIQEWFLGREINSARDEVEFYIRAGYDFVPVLPPFFAPRIMRTARNGQSDADSERGWLTESEGLIKTMDDVESFPWPDPDDVDFSSFHEVAALLPPKMKIIGMLSPAAIFGNVSQAMGLENFSYALYDRIDVIEALFEKIGSTYERITRRLVGMPRLGAVFMSDDLAHGAGPLVSPAVYRKYVFPWYRIIGGILEDAGLPWIFHSDGRLDVLLDDLHECGVKAIHPIEPNAMDIVKTKEQFGDKFCIFGNIDLEYTLTRGSVGDVEALVKKRIGELAPGGGWGLAASNSVPDYVKPENYRAMVAAGKKYGKYPIGGGLIC
jgi:uroporphyrinogen decarboxylase